MAANRNNPTASITAKPTLNTCICGAARAMKASAIWVMYRDRNEGKRDAQASRNRKGRYIDQKRQQSSGSVAVPTGNT
ncbi:MAG: hypothetical protein QM784_06750 [Polyangiaceae bacterium]